jgi:hypothetical protein
VVSYINAIFPHGCDGSWIYTMCFYPGTVNFHLFSAEMFEIAMCHLAAAAVACTKDEDLFLNHVVNKLKK